QLLVPDGDQGYAFRHALLREAAYADLLPGERTRMHATLAELLADPVRLAVPGTAAELAHHSLASHDIPGGVSPSVQAVRGGGGGGGAAGGARRGTPALRSGPCPLGPGHRPGEAGRHAARLAGLQVGDQRRGQRRAAPRGSATAAAPQLRHGRGRPGAVLPG